MEEAVRLPLLKRPFDVSLSLLGLVLSVPLWILIALAIWLEDGRPIFYLQERVGRAGRRFKTWKFRSMIKDAEVESGPVAAAQDDSRITKVGAVLRNTAMDELPQLINILKGDMSFVGPRADRPWEVEPKDGDLSGSAGSIHNPDFFQLIPNYQARLQVRPGLTGLAQIYAKYDTPRRQKLRFDLLYIRNVSFWLDLKLILLSFWITMRGSWESRDNKF